VNEGTIIFVLVLVHENITVFHTCSFTSESCAHEVTGQFLTTFDFEQMYLEKSVSHVFYAVWYIEGCCVFNLLLVKFVWIATDNSKE
jgi:hypothetical protein